jgi:hypothetical protein
MANEYKYGELQDWDEAEVKTGSEFMKLVEGDNVVRITDGAGVPRKIRAAAERNCPLKKRGEKLQNRWYVGVINRKTKSAQVMEISSQIVSAIKKLYKDEDWGDPEQYDINVCRGPAGSQPLYTVIAKPKKPLNDDDKAMVARFVENTDLKKMTTPPTPEEVAERLAAIEGGQVGNSKGQQQGGSSRGNARGNTGGRPGADPNLFSFDDEQI